MSLPIRGPFSSNQCSTVMTSFNFNHFQKALSPIQLAELGLSHMDLGGKVTLVPSRWQVIGVSELRNDMI